MGRFVFRADASTTIGTGHVMRCMALAVELKRRGHESVFACADEPGNLCGLLEERGFGVYRLPAAGLGMNQLQDADAMLDRFRGERADWLIVDHYRLDAQWERRVAGVARCVMAIDDLADRPHDCDLLLDQNLYPGMHSRYASLASSRCRQLLGPSYALLRTEFAQAREAMTPRSGSVRRVLVTFGGSDPGNETAKVLRALMRLSQRAPAIDVVIGTANPHRAGIEELCRSMPSVSLHVQATNMAELMLHADFAIGAGGTASWERCCVGLPCAVIAIADNQHAVSLALEEAGAARYLGRSEEITEDILVQQLDALMQDGQALREMSAKALALADGHGTMRVCDALCGDDAIRLRRAVDDDAMRLLAWRNTPEVRSSSFNDRQIEADEHLQWFGKVLRDPARHLLVAEVGGEPFGALRYDTTGEEAEVSIYLNPAFIGKGLGTRLLEEGHRWLRQTAPAIATIRAGILPSNAASRKAFMKAGYTAHGEDYRFDLRSGGDEMEQDT